MAVGVVCINTLDCYAFTAFTTLKIQYRERKTKYFYLRKAVVIYKKELFFLL